MTNIGKSITISGSLQASEPLTIAGSIKGEIQVPEHEVLLESPAHVEGLVMARAIGVSGEARGRLVAREVVRLRSGAVVQADIAAPRLALEEGTLFNGRVDPARTDAAFKVAEHRGKG